MQEVDNFCVVIQLSYPHYQSRQEVVDNFCVVIQLSYPHYQSRQKVVDNVCVVIQLSYHHHQSRQKVVDNFCVVIQVSYHRYQSRQKVVDNCCVVEQYPSVGFNAQCILLMKGQASFHSIKGFLSYRPLIKPAVWRNICRHLSKKRFILFLW